MFGRNPIDDAVRLLRASATNQIARVFPSLYFRAVHDTGRGPADATEEELADYAFECFADYARHASISARSDTLFLEKRILEYGPGDFPGAAILMIAHGAHSVVCVDRFPLLAMTDFNVRALECLLSRLSPSLRDRAAAVLADPSSPSRGFAPNRLKYLIAKDGLSGLSASVDFVFSRAVLEHVNDLPATLVDIKTALRPDGIAVHLVDLKSHRLHRQNKLDFLTWPEPMWRLMFSAKGAPNRLRPDAYRQAIHAAGLEIVSMDTTGVVPLNLVQEVRPHLAARFRNLDDEDLRWEGFWVVLRKLSTVADRPSAAHSSA